MALEPEDRTEDLVQGHRSDFVAGQSNAQAVPKEKGDCRFVVEFPFRFSKEFLRSKSDLHGENYIDGVDYLRQLKKEWEQGNLDLGDLVEMTIEHGDGALRIEAAK